MLLAHLLTRAGKLVTRAELKEAIWPSGTYVEFDLALNSAMSRLRQAIRDSAASPRYIATVPKQGYRFIAPVELVLPSPEKGPELVEPQATAEPHSGEGEDSTSITPRTPPRRWKTPAAIAATLLAAGAVAWSLIVRTQEAGRSGPGTVLRSSLLLPPTHIPEVVVISPAGDQVVYQALVGGVRRLYRRFFDEKESRPIPGSEGGTQPFFSPDGKEIGFYSPATIRVTGPRGSRDLAPVPPEFDVRRAVWGEDQFIYYTTPDDGIWRVPANGGAPQAFLKPMPTDRGSPLYFPQQIFGGLSPGVLLSTNNGPIKRWIAWAPLSGESPPQVVIERGMGGFLAPTGHLLYYWQDKLLAAPFDRRTHRVSGAAVEVLNRVAANGWRGPNASVAANGTLVYLEASQVRRKLLWVDRNGRETPVPVPLANYEQAEVSPDGTRLSLVRQDSRDAWTLAIYDLRSQSWTRVLDTDVPRPRSVWSPDGKALVVSAAVQGDSQFVNLYRFSLASLETPERLTEEPNFGQFPASWSGAAHAILFTEGVHTGTQSDVLALPLDGARRPRVLVATKGPDRSPVFSPDGRWFAYSSDTQHGSEIFIEPFDQSSPPRQVSVDGGLNPAWSPDGRKLYYLSRGQALMEVPYRGNGSTGAPRQLFPPGFTEPSDWWTRGYCVAYDGRFLVIRDVTDESTRIPQINIVVNWVEELKRLVPAP